MPSMFRCYKDKAKPIQLIHSITPKHTNIKGQIILGFYIFYIWFYRFYVNIINILITYFDYKGPSS